MNRETLRWPLVFVLVVLVCGGGCIGPAYWGPMQNDLVMVGLDDHTRARLDGQANPRPSDPEPETGLSGKLIVYPFTGYVPTNDAVPDPQAYGQTPGKIGQLAGIESVQGLNLHWSTTYPQPEDRRPLSAKEYQRVLLDLAEEQGGDLLFVYVVKQMDGDEFDLTFSILPILTLGLAPTTFVSSEMELEAALIDVKTGYIYAVLSSKGDGLEITNFWNRGKNRHDARDEALSEATESLVEKLEAAWPMMQQAYP